MNCHKPREILNLGSYSKQNSDNQYEMWALPLLCCFKGTPFEFSMKFKQVLFFSIARQQNLIQLKLYSILLPLI